MSSLLRPDMAMIEAAQAPKPHNTSPINLKGNRVKVPIAIYKHAEIIQIEVLKWN